jgi:hypothetical protein
VCALLHDAMARMHLQRSGHQVVRHVVVTAAIAVHKICNTDCGVAMFGSPMPLIAGRCNVCLLGKFACAERTTAPYWMMQCVEARGASCRLAALGLGAILQSDYSQDAGPWLMTVVNLCADGMASIVCGPRACCTCASLPTTLAANGRIVSAWALSCWHRECSSFV